jgi:RES domain-containing protein
MEVFRLSKSRYASTLSGIGASIKGGRWNSPGTEIIYTASNRSLAMAEVAVHLTLATLPSDYMMVKIFIPHDKSIKTVQVKDITDYWNSRFHNPSIQKLGDDFIKENKYCILKTPSAVTKGDFNILINVYHPDFKRIKIINIEPFPFDERIFKP